MKKLVYVLKNNSYSTGSYVVNGVTKTVFPRSIVELDVEPTSYTSNLIKSCYYRDVITRTPRRNISKEEPTEEK